MKWEILRPKSLQLKNLEPKSLKVKRLCGELKECTLITARKKKFLLKKVKSSVTVERKPFLVILNHAITAHMFQESTLDYAQGDLN